MKEELEQTNMASCPVSFPYPHGGLCSGQQRRPKQNSSTRCALLKLILVTAKMLWQSLGNYKKKSSSFSRLAGRAAPVVTELTRPPFENP